MLSDLFIDSKSIMKRLCGAGTFGDYGYTPCVLSSFKDLEELWSWEQEDRYLPLV